MGIERIFKRRSGIDRPNSKIDYLEAKRKEVGDRADEFNALNRLANHQAEEAREEFLKRDDVEELVPLIVAIVKSAVANNSGIWLTSLIEAEGNILGAWDLVEKKKADMREESWKKRHNDLTPDSQN